MRIGYLVEGMVQGVGFRHFTWRQAQRLGLRGWVRNLPDGRVEAVAEGDAEALARFGEALASGPRMARVTAVHQGQISDEADPLTSFEIR